MQGRQKLFYLPEAHTDTIYAVVGEEFGLFGSVALLLGFVVILWRGIRATVLIPDEFGRYLALGVTTMLVIQAFFNMSVVLGMVPTKGIPLPMISFRRQFAAGDAGVAGNSAECRRTSEHARVTAWVCYGGRRHGRACHSRDRGGARSLPRGASKFCLSGRSAAWRTGWCRPRDSVWKKFAWAGSRISGCDAHSSSLWRLVSETAGQMARFGPWKPAAVFSMGGYVAGPPVLAALLRGVPVVVMEPNAVPGFTNRWIARWVKRRADQFRGDGAVFPNKPDGVDRLAGARGVFSVPPKEPGGEFTVLITGGSQGSRTLNEAARQSWPLFREAGLAVRLIHQTGTPMYESMARRFRETGLSGESAEFIGTCRARSPGRFDRVPVRRGRGFGTGGGGQTVDAGSVSLSPPISTS
jgi:hypothetical protein